MPTILIVEDDNILSRAIRRSLEDSKYDTIAALNGDEALKKLKTNKIDLVLLDLILPKKLGEDVLAEIRKNPKTAYLPVLVSTVKNDQDSINRCIALGIQGYFIKAHYTLDEIVSEVKITLARKTKFKM